MVASMRISCVVSSIVSVTCLIEVVPPRGFLGTSIITIVIHIRNLLGWLRLGWLKIA